MCSAVHIGSRGRGDLILGMMWFARVRDVTCAGEQL